MRGTTGNPKPGESQTPDMMTYRIPQTSCQQSNVHLKQSFAQSVATNGLVPLQPGYLQARGMSAQGSSKLAKMMKSSLALTVLFLAMLL